MKKFCIILFFMSISIFGLTGCSATRWIFQLFTSEEFSPHVEYFLVFHPNETSSQFGGYGYLMDYSQDGYVYVAGKFPCTYGEKGVPKTKRGDRKTPLGKYRIELIRSKEDQYNQFGPYSILIDYPNHFDIIARRTGSGISIHGGRIKPTNGCIRILNGTSNKPKFGKVNITEIVKRCQTGDIVFIVDSINAKMLGEPGECLSEEASRKWIYLLENEMDYLELLQELNSL
ncbi:MAG: L,D-transpeptidase family protein [Candidatus Hatepunaea meridiana]|nr:L,D-transpeptidase family protein [Candidatus Hatepunaea meridiana]